MSKNPDELEELLNGLLDGVLTDEEQVRLDAAMKSDPALETRLSEMQALRSSLLRGRSVGRLGPEFSKKVVEESRKRADMLGDRAPEWLRTSQRRNADRVAKRVAPPSEPRVRLTLSSESEEESPTISQRAWRVWIPSLALAALASVTLYYAGSLLVPRMEVETLMSRSDPKGDPKGDPKSSSEKEDQKTLERAVELLLKDSPAVVKSDATSRSSPPSESAATEVGAPVEGREIEKMADASPSGDPTKVPGGDFPAGDRVASDPLPGKSQLPPEVEKMMKSRGIQPDQAVYTFIAEVVVSPTAENEQLLKDLLDEHEIVYTEDANLSDSELDALVSTQMVGMLAGVDAEKRSNEVQVYFVRARGRKIDAFLVDVQGLYEAFPGYHLDMSFDPSVLKLVDQLRSIMTTDDSARRLTFRSESGLGLVTAFPAGDRNVEYIDVERRKRAAQKMNSIVSKSSDMNSYMLLLVRKAESSK